MSRRLYLGRLPPDTRTEDVSKFFEGYGHMIDCRVMTGFGFVEFESNRDAEDALNQFGNKPFMGQNIVVEFAKESRPRRDPYHDTDRARTRRPPGVRLVVTGVSRDTSWQDLKDFGREAGSVSFADIDRDNPGNGILEYLSRDDAEHAVKELDGRDLRGRPVRVALDESRGGADNYRRDDRRDDRYSRRSRSPPRYDDRRRSPPPRRDYDDRDRRPSGSDGDRRPRDDYERRPREDHERRPRDDYERRPRDDDRRRDDYDRRSTKDDDRRRDDRTEDRPARSNGDGGWSR